MLKEKNEKKKKKEKPASDGVKEERKKWLVKKLIKNQENIACEEKSGTRASEAISASGLIIDLASIEQWYIK